MSRSTIEWTTDTWNPVTGCTKVSPGCDHCYAERFAERWRNVPGHPYTQGFDLTLRPERLSYPRSLKRPRRIFVNSMSDLFHAHVPSDFIEAVFKAMADAHWHQFQLLTKRAERLERLAKQGLSFPPNVWVGVSVESPEFYWRIEHLRRVAAAVRFLSCEPLLAPLPTMPLEGIHWVIVGGESGPGARPMMEEWAADIKRQCDAAKVPFFFKQWGGPRKASTGRTLLGRTWDAMPTVNH